MKRMLISIFAVVLLLVSFSSVMTATAPDTIRIWASTDYFDDVINNNAGNHVFLLQNTTAVDTSFLIMAPITVAGNVTVIGRVNPVTGKPPVIQPGIDASNSSISDFFEPQGSDTLTLKGLYFFGTRSDGACNSGRLVVPVGDNHVFIMDHCIFENIVGPQATPNLFDTWGHAHCSFYVTNCEFRNCQHDAVDCPSVAWIECGDPTTIACDTAIFRNNTFFSFAGCILGSNGRAPSQLIFEHNTIYNSTRQGIFQIKYLHNAVIRNNVFWNVGALSQPTSWGNTAGYGGWFSGLIVLDSLADTLKSTFSSLPLTEAERSIDISHNAYQWPAQDTAYWTANACMSIPLVSARASMYDAAQYPNITIANNDSIDLGYDATLDTLAANAMTTMITTYYTNWSANGYRPYLYSMPTIDDANGIITWNDSVPSDWATTKGYPVGENLRYTNSSYLHASTDGLPLGDLNWFPDVSAVVGVSQSVTSAPRKFVLEQNYPNPFNPSTRISYETISNGMTHLTVYDLLGREVAVLVNGVQKAGQYTVTLNASHLSSGVYFYKLENGGMAITKRMLLLK